MLHLYDQSRSCLIWFLSQSALDPKGHESLKQFSMQTTLVRSVTLLSYLVFMTDGTRFHRSRQFNINLDVDRICLFGHVIVSSIFLHKPYLVVLSRQFSFMFGVYHTCIIEQVIALSAFRHNWHLILPVTKVQYHFWHRIDQYDQSRYCPIWFSSQIAPD